MDSLIRKNLWICHEDTWKASFIVDTKPVNWTYFLPQERTHACLCHISGYVKSATYAAGHIILQFLKPLQVRKVRSYTEGHMIVQFVKCLGVPEVRSFAQVHMIVQCLVRLGVPKVHSYTEEHICDMFGSAKSP